MSASGVEIHQRMLIIVIALDAQYVVSMCCSLVSPRLYQRFVFGKSKCFRFYLLLVLCEPLSYSSKHSCSQFDDFENKAKEMCGSESDYKTSNMSLMRKRRNKCYDDQRSDEGILKVPLQ